MSTSSWLFGLAVGLLVLAALGGAALAGFLFVGQARPPRPLVFAHGAAAVLALAFALLGGLLTRFSPLLAGALAALAVAAAAGARLLARQARGRPLSPGAVGLHALLALGGFVALVVALLL